MCDKFPLLLKEGCHDAGVTGWLIKMLYKYVMGLIPRIN
jgi:hypothetical protein